MNEEKFQDFIKSLFREQITKTYSHDRSTYKTNVIDEQGRIIVEQAIRSFMLDNRDEQTGILEAKVFMYEQIISKSNFAPMIKQIKSENSANG